MNSTKMRNNTRRILVLVLVSVIGWKFFYPIMTRPLQTKRDAIAKEARELEHLQDQLGLYTGYLRQVRETGKQCLQPDAMAASIRYQEWLRGLCEEVGIADPNITIKEPLPEEGVGARVQINMQSKAPLAAVGELIDLLSAASITHRIVKIDLKDWESSSNRIGVSVDLDALSLQENPTFDPTLLTQTIEPRGFGQFVDERKSFSRYIPPQPVIREASEANSMSVSTEPIMPPRPDALKTFVLIGIVQRNGNPRALFRDNLKSTDVVVELDQEVRVDQFAGRVAEIGSDQITLVEGQKLIQVSLGQSLREGVERTQDSEIF